MNFYNKAKWIFCILAVLCSAYIAYRFYDQQFRLTNIKASADSINPMPVSYEKMQEFHLIFLQPFFYIDRGKQSYVFASSDGKYVLKFFDMRCQQSGALPLLIPISKKRCAKKISRLIIGYETAMKYDKDHTGLIYAQLAPNPLNTFTATVIDRFGIKEYIDLSKVPFALQLRAIPTKDVISQFLNHDDVSKAKISFVHILNMYVEEYHKGIIDLDHNVMYNTGFVGEKPIRIDVGRLKYDEKVKDPQVYQSDLNHVIERIEGWLDRHFPKYKEEIMKGLKQSMYEELLPFGQHFRRQVLSNG